jgi:hypothetical protein
MSQICTQQQTINNIERSIAASKIKWATVEKWRKQLNYKSNEEMLLDWMFNKEELHKRGLLRRPNPFHKHVRNLLDNMEHLGVANVGMVIDQGLMLTKDQIAQYREYVEEQKDEQTL